MDSCTSHRAGLASRAALGLLLGGLVISSLVARGSVPGTVLASGPNNLPAQPGVANSPEALLTLNKAFRAAYARGRAATLAQTTPVILHQGDSVVLFHGARRIEIDYMPRLYHELKTFAHVPLALYVMTHPRGYGQLGEERLVELRRFRELVVAARAEIAKRGFTATQRERQEKLVSQSLAFLDGQLAERSVNREQLADFTRAVGPLQLANADDAARAQLEALHTQVMAWKKELPAADWKHLRVVVMGSHTPRRGNLAMQYFARILGDPVDDRRLIYAEGLGDEKRALDLLGTCVLDTGVGASFFGDELRMHRDLLADAATKHLQSVVGSQ